MTAKKENRFAIQSIHMNNSTFEIHYYDRRNKIEHVAKGFTSLIDSEAWEVMGPALDFLVTKLREENPIFTVHALGEPFPEKVVKVD